MTISWMGVLIHTQTLIQTVEEGRIFMWIKAGYGNPPPKPVIIGLSMSNLISDQVDAALSA